MSFVPLMIDVTDRQIVIVGGGKIAERRVYALIDKGAVLKIISPTLSDSLLSLWNEGRIAWEKRPFEEDDINHASLIIAATNDRKVNDSIKTIAPKDSLLNMTGEARQGNVIFPSTMNRGRLTISVSTGGASPMLASKILKNLESEYDNRYESYIDFLHECRKLLKRSNIGQDEKNKMLKHILDEKYMDTEKQLETVEWLKEEYE
ncbi:NAD(P)-binding protein [Salinicoccus roseus]|uniref:NAD(P)-binding protein n=1 Tax=Salinicoccus roseus TaxID=45670 RepID=UPI0035677188